MSCAFSIICLGIIHLRSAQHSWTFIESIDFSCLLVLEYSQPQSYPYCCIWGQAFSEKGQRVCVWLAGPTLPGCLPTKYHRQPWSAVTGDQSAFSRFLGVTFSPLNMVSLRPPMSSASVVHSSRSPTNPACRWAVTYSSAGWGTLELVPVWGCHKKAVMNTHLQSLERLSFLLGKYLWDGACMWVWVHCVRKFPSSSPEWLCHLHSRQHTCFGNSCLGLWLVFSLF